jgi:hypothetical protein
MLAMLRIGAVELKDAITVLGVLIAAIPLAFVAINTRLALRASRARFWLDLRDAFRNMTRYTGACAPEVLGLKARDPTAAEEWAEVEAYMGLFEHCEVLLEENLIDERTFKEIYALSPSKHSAK